MYGVIDRGWVSSADPDKIKEITKNICIVSMNADDQFLYGNEKKKSNLMLATNLTVIGKRKTSSLGFCFTIKCFCGYLHEKCV